MDGESEQQSLTRMGEMPTFIRDATKHAQPMIAEDPAAEDEEEDLIPSEQDEQNIASQATSVDSSGNGRAKNPRRSQRRIARSTSDRNEDAARVVEDSLVSQLEVYTLCNCCFATLLGTSQPQQQTPLLT